jgi:DNA-binding MarR family transcriptional regulator
VIAETALSKDAVSKLVSALVDAGLLSQVREASDPRSKRLAITDRGRDLVRRLNAEIQTPPSKAEVKVRPGGFVFEEAI